MALELRQQLKLSQQLVMTPQLQQAIKLLQLSRLELVETVNQELMENPLLEEGFDDPELNLDSDGREPAVQSDVVREMPGDENALRREADWDNYLGDFASASRQSQVREYEALEEGQGFEARLTGKHSLDGHLAWQIRLSDFTEQEMEIAEYILGNLDSSGYLASPVEEIAEATQAGPDDVERVLKRVQRFDPLGVAARDPRECLLVQIEALGYDDPILVSLISEHLEDLEKKRYKPLARKFKLTLEELKEYLDVIQTLDPMPGSSFGTSEPVYVSPDAYVYKFEDEFVILLNEEGLPRLQLSSMYMDCLQGAKCKEKDYFQEKMRSAVWLMKSLYQRQRTLFKVLESIVKFQRNFFEEGVKHLKPLILKDVADDISMHESTVSRITTNKYVATPHGTFELKFFFNSALTLDDGSEVGSESVKALIKQLIGKEDSHQPLSDEKIVDILKDKLQVNIARRTVAKYRTALNIPSSSKRKEIF